MVGKSTYVDMVSTGTPRQARFVLGEVAWGVLYFSIIEYVLAIISRGTSSSPIHDFYSPILRPKNLNIVCELTWAVVPYVEDCLLETATATATV